MPWLLPYQLPATLTGPQMLSALAVGVVVGVLAILLIEWVARRARKEP